MKKIVFLFGFVFLAWLTSRHPVRASPAPGQPYTRGAGLSFEEIGHAGGDWSGPILQDGDYVYTALGEDFVIMDVSNPGRPARVGSLKLFPWGRLLDIARQGPQVFLVGLGSIYIVDVADAAHPALLSALSITTGSTLSLAVSGDTAYIGCTAGFYVLDITDPRQPVVAGKYMAMENIHDLAVVGKYAYLALSGYESDYSGLAVLDVSSPTSPALVTLPSFQYQAYGLAVSGSYAYVTQGGLRIYDISNPSAPAQAGYFNFSGGDKASRLVIQGNYVFIAAQANGVYVIDISDPAHPAQVGLYDLHGRDDPHVDDPFEYWDVSVAGSTAYIAVNHPAGLEIVDISNPASPALTGASTGPGMFIYGASLTPQYVYVTDDVGLNVIDRSDPRNPYSVSYTEFSQAAGTPTISGDIAYIPHGDLGLRIMDITDPAHPVQIALYDTPGDGVSSVAVAGRYAYVSDSSTFRVLDVSAPFTPTEVGFLEAGNTFFFNEMVLTGKYAVVAGETGYYNSAGFRILDISNPQQPVILGGVSSVVPHDGIEVQGRYAYLTAYSGASLRIWDISNPTLPVYVAGGETPYPQAHSLDVAGEYAYVVNFGALYVFDISDPAHPDLVSEYGTRGYTAGVNVDGNYVYLSTQWGYSTLRTLAEVMTTTIGLGGGSLSSASGDIQVVIPGGAFTQTARVTCKRLLVDQDTAGLLGTGSTFELAAVVTDTLRPAALAPGEIFTITVSYTPAQLGGVIEDTLALYYWSGDQWVLEPTSSLDASSRTLTAAADKIALWAVLGKTKRTFLPAVWR